MADIHDMSTSGGAISRFLFRWKYPLMVGTIVLIAVGATLYLKADSEIPESTFVISGSTLMYHGNRSKFEDRYFDHFPGFPISELALGTKDSSPAIDTIEIKWVRISGPEFSSQLARYAPTLRILHLDNITIEDHLQPIRLPLLEEFYLNQGLEPEERESPDYQMTHGFTPWLHSTLFFLNDNSSDFPSKTDKAFRANINVTVYLKGSVNYQLNPRGNEVKLDIANCTDILKKLPNTFTNLTLGRCRDLTPTSIHPGVTFLNFYIVYLKTEQLSGILRNLKNLEEFYAEIPDGPVDISLNDLSPKLRVLSASSMHILNSGNKVYPNIKEFYFGAENQYSWIPDRVTSLNETLALQFGQIFPQVEKVGLFDLKSGDRYTFLQSVINTPSVKLILLENFLRGKNATGNSTNAVMDDVAFDFVEHRFDEYGLENDASDIVIDTSLGPRGGRLMTRMEKLWFRYIFLGWSPIDSWPKYNYVQKIIENGGLL